MGRDELQRLSLEQLRDEARRRGLPEVRALTHAQLVDLLAAGDRDGADEWDAPAPPDLDRPVEFSTLTMARLYSQQGEWGRAAVLFRSLMSGRGSTSRAKRLAARIAAVGDPELSDAPRRGARSYVPMEPTEPEAVEPLSPLPQGYGGSRLILVPVNPTLLYAWWEAHEPASSRVGDPQEVQRPLVLRLFSAWRGSGGVERATRDREVEGPTGEAFLEGAKPGAIHRAALGTVGDGAAFEPICHSGPAETPPGRASRLFRSEVATVARRPERRSNPLRRGGCVGRLSVKVPMGLPWEARTRVAWPEPAPPPEEGGRGADQPREPEPSGSSWSA